jgi:hypothetical protein
MSLDEFSDHRQNGLGFHSGCGKFSSHQARVTAFRDTAVTPSGEAGKPAKIPTGGSESSQAVTHPIQYISLSWPWSEWRWNRDDSVTMDRRYQRSDSVA